jgi:signal peptidase I
VAPEPFVPEPPVPEPRVNERTGDFAPLLIGPSNPTPTPPPVEPVHVHTPVADYVSGRVASLPIQAPLNRDPVQLPPTTQQPVIQQPAAVQPVAPVVEAADPWAHPISQVEVTDGNLFLPPMPAMTEAPAVAEKPQQPEHPKGRKRRTRDDEPSNDELGLDSPPKKRTVLGTIGSLAREALIVVVGALLASTLLRLFVVQLFEIPSGSMEPLVQGGPGVETDDRVAVQKIFGFERGDAVVFRDTQGWLGEEPAADSDWLHIALVFVGLAPDESTGYLIKRVIGMPGDRVACCDAQGRITVNGTPLDESSYLYVDPATGEQVNPSNNTFDVTVPEGRIFVMGDHRNSSMDSRCHLPEEVSGEPRGIKGFVPVENVVGTAVARVFPFDRFTGISRPATFEQVPDATESPPPEPVINGEITQCVSG